jgi:hypothetical protein
LEFAEEDDDDREVSEGAARGSEEEPKFWTLIGTLFSFSFLYFCVALKETLIFLFLLSLLMVFNQVRIHTGSRSQSRLQSRQSQKDYPPPPPASASASFAWSSKGDGRRTAAQDTFGLRDHSKPRHPGGAEPRSAGSVARQGSLLRQASRRGGDPLGSPV